MKSSVAEDRRLKLQEYLRSIVHLISVDPKSPLHGAVTKDSLIDAIPFFKEDILGMSALADIVNDDDE